MIAKDNGAGQDHDAVIPNDTDVELHIFSRDFDVEDEKGAALDKAQGAAIPVRVSGGKNPPQLKFRIAGVR